MVKLLKQQIVKNKYEELKKTLKSSNPDLDELYRGKSLLHFAVSKGNLKFVKLLLAQGADLGVKDKNGNTPLHLAVKKGYFHIVEEMLGISVVAEERKASSSNNQKLSILEQSQTKALQLLKQKNKKDDTPLHLAARLKNHRIYDTLISLDPGYSNKQLKEIESLRLQRYRHKKIKAFFDALFGVVRPSVSMNKLLESFAYVGLLAGTTAAIGVGINMAFIALACVGLGMIVLASYKKNLAQQKSRQKFELCQINLAHLNNLSVRLQELTTIYRERKLTRPELSELRAMKEALEKINKPPRIRGNATNAKDYVSRKEVFYTIVSGFGSFLCAYSGLLGLMGVSLAITSAVTGIGIGALLVSAGAIGVSVVLAAGLVLALGLAIYRFNKLKPQFLAFGEMRMKLSDQRKMICSTQQRLKPNLRLIDALIQDEVPLFASNDNIILEDNNQGIVFARNKNYKRNSIFSSPQLPENDSEDTEQRFNEMRQY